MAWCYFHAKFKNAQVKVDYYVCAICESGTVEALKLARFSYMMPFELRSALDCWVDCEMADSGPRRSICSGEGLPFGRVGYNTTESSSKATVIRGTCEWW